jgi:phosphohistidine phosphatase
MKRLILMRHAKSDWDHPGLEDHERPLNARGQKAAKALGDWMRTNSYLPDQALVSFAARTQETFARLGLNIDAVVKERLYLASPDMMYDHLLQATGDTVLMIAHNPGSAYFAEGLLREPPHHPRFDAYPTCATLVADFDIMHWIELEPNTGVSVDFTVPRDLI